MRRVLILGGGFGGIATAHALRQELSSEDEIVIVERRSHFMFGLRKTWVLVGKATMEEGQRPLEALQERGIQVMPGTVTAIDPANRAAEIDGQRREADALVVALGAELAPQEIPGFESFAHNVYSAQDLPRTKEALRHFSGGRLGIGIFAVPYTCPPAPFELALLLKQFFPERNVRAEIEVFSPQPMSLPVLGQEGCAVLEERLLQEGITFLPNHKATAIEQGEVIFADGKRRSYDLLLGVPPHRCSQVVVDSGLTAGGAWVRVDPRTMETSFPGVYAIGDLTEITLANGLPLPKAGVFAEQQGQVVAERIADSFAGRQPKATFPGVGHCFMEVGKGQAVLVRGQFLAEPPKVEMTEPSAENLAKKHAFEEVRLAAWFEG